MMPPTPVRRPLTITVWIVVSLAYLALSPLLLLLAALASNVMRRPQLFLLARMLVVYFARELGVLLACGALWVRSGFGWRIRGPRMQRLHYRLLEWFVHGLAAEALGLLDIRVAPDVSPAARSALEHDRPLLCFSRHAGPGDTIFIVDLLQSRYGRLPSVVFRDALSLDPSVDLIGHRLPHAVLDSSDRQECLDRIESVAANLGPRGVLLLFPEGGNFTPERRRRALRKLWRKGRRPKCRRDFLHPHRPGPGRLPQGDLAQHSDRPDAEDPDVARAAVPEAAGSRRAGRLAVWMVEAAGRVGGGAGPGRAGVIGSAHA